MASLSIKIKKYAGLVEHLEANQQIWQAIGALQTSVDQAKTIIELLDKPVEKKIKEPKKNTEKQASSTEKKEARTALIKKTISVAGSLYAYALDSADKNLKAVAIIDIAKFEKKSNAMLAKTSLSIHKNIQDNLANLAHYGVQQSEIDELEQSVKSFKAITLTKVITKKAPKLPKVKISPSSISELDALFKNKIDKLLFRFEDSHNDFYKVYTRKRNAIVPKTPKKTKEIVEATTTDAKPVTRKGRPKKA